MNKVNHDNNISNRGKEWLEFSQKVFEHIEKYTVPQYGDLNFENPTLGDQMSSASLEDIQMNLKRYINRLNSNSRGPVESLRDLFKIAHYAAIIFGKYQRGEINSVEEKKFNFIDYVDSNQDNFTEAESKLFEEINKYIAFEPIDSIEVIVRKKKK